MKLRILALAGLAAVTLTGCGGGDKPSAASSSSAALDTHQAMVAAAKCMRDNGFPDYPDPVENNGVWDFPGASGSRPQPPPACMHYFNQAKGGGDAPKVSADDITKLRKWADCIRKQGILDWPDPDTEGRFHQPARLNPLDENQEWRKASDACLSVQPPVSIDFDNPNKPRR
jgi:hypothetical protein